jgi:ribonucleoside-diphosphate reductase alpha chain
MLNNQEFNISDRLSLSSKAVLKDRYLLPNETFQDMVNRVVKAYSDNEEHAMRMVKYISLLWFMPATPILSNGGTGRGLPISCFLNECEDSLKGIVALWQENVAIASKGGGIGSYWSGVRSIGEPVAGNGATSGIMPFIKVMDSMTLGISQGSLRRGSAATYLRIDHPEVEEFIEMRRPTGGDHNRKCLNLHHGICITDDFMVAVEDNDQWHLRSPKTNEVISTVAARDLWIKILTARLETGEPYILNIDAVNRSTPQHHRQLGLTVKTSNLCSEITLPTGIDHLGNDRTAVCCLSSLNLEYFDEWHDNEQIIPDIMRFLDNVLTDFINRAPDEMAKAKYSAMRERSVGLGVMGFHSYLQFKMVPFESAVAKAINVRIFKHIKAQADQSSYDLAVERGACPDAQECGVMERFSNKIAIAPTASISIIAGESSPCIEPYNANVYIQKNLTGSFIIVNKHLKTLLDSKGKLNDDVLSNIATHEGSVQHLEFLDDYEKKVFKTANEIDQLWVIEHAADRTPFICQAQSTNLFISGNIDKSHLHLVHYTAWKKGLKSLYYLRSTAVSRADKISHKHAVISSQIQDDSENDSADTTSSELSDNPISKYDECLACQ